MEKGRGEEKRKEGRKGGSELVKEGGRRRRKNSGCFDKRNDKRQSRKTRTTKLQLQTIHKCNNNYDFDQRQQRRRQQQGNHFKDIIITQD